MVEKFYHTYHAHHWKPDNHAIHHYLREIVSYNALSPLQKLPIVSCYPESLLPWWQDVTLLLSIAQIYRDRDTLDFSEGHVTKN